MENQTLSDLERMKAERQRAEEEYRASLDAQLEAKRIEREGIASMEDLIFYINYRKEQAKKANRQLFIIMNHFFILFQSTSS